MSRQRGFALFELALVLLITTLAAVFAADRFAERSREVVVEGHAAWLRMLHEATSQYLAQHGDSLAMLGTAASIEGFAEAMAPTLAELKAAGLLAEGFPMQGARDVAGRVQVLRDAGCPHEPCRIEALIYSDAPLGRDASRPYRLPMVAHWLSVSRGQGAAIMPDRPFEISGAAFSFANPPVAGMTPLPVGTVALAVTAGSPGSSQFLRVGDLRNPDFKGEASIEGDISTQGLLRVREHLHIESQATAQAICTPEGAIVRERYGGLLVCRGGRWRSAGGSGGGGYSVNNLSGCQPAAANPVTGDCSCPSNYMPVRIADSTSAVPSEGRTRGYLCVG